MPRVETVIPPEPKPATYQDFFTLPLAELKLGVANHNARPGPLPKTEEVKIKRLAASMREIGQIAPIVVKFIDGQYIVIDGARRRAAAMLIESETGKLFPLECILRREADSRLAIHANVHRQGLTPLQLAHLIANLRIANRWTGTKEVADYLGVSRAQVSQHDKLLHRPTDMPQATYDDLIAKVGSGLIGADTAFYALTHVEAPKSAKVLDRAQEIADAEKGPETATDQPIDSPIAPRAGKQPKQASGKAPATAKQARAGSTKPKVPAPGPAKVEKRHVQQAAKEQKAVKASAPPIPAKVVSELPDLLNRMSTTAYPDPMRSLVSTLKLFTLGSVPAAEVLVHWDQIRLMVEESQALHRKQAPATDAGKSGRKTNTKKSK